MVLRGMMDERYVLFIWATSSMVGTPKAVDAFSFDLSCCLDPYYEGNADLGVIAGAGVGGNIGKKGERGAK